MLGFSLVELMISLIAISAIAAAFTPAITKKISKSISVAITGGCELSAACKYNYNDNCILCYKEDGKCKNPRCVMCTLSCNDGEYKRIDTCVCETCAGRDPEKDPDSKCIKCNSTECKKCKSGYGVHEGGCVRCGVEANGTLGMYSDGTTDCIQAREGHYVNQEGASTDTECSEGTYAPQGSSSCTQCPVGTYSTAGSASCSIC